jgi:hypothetical protein
MPGGQEDQRVAVVASGRDDDGPGTLDHGVLERGLLRGIGPERNQA